MEGTTNKSRAYEIGAWIRDYFGEVENETQVYMMGNVADVTISYEDFKPVRTVRKDIEDRWPEVCISEIHRGYSYDAETAVLRDMLDNDELIYVRGGDGDTLHPLRMSELITERLYNRTIEPFNNLTS